MGNETLFQSIMSREQISARGFKEKACSIVRRGEMKPLQPRNYFITGKLHTCANVSIISCTSSPNGYRIGQVQPLRLYSSTFARTSSGVPLEVMRSINAFGTNCVAS